MLLTCVLEQSWVIRVPVCISLSNLDFIAFSYVYYIRLTIYICYQSGELVVKSYKSLLDWRRSIERSSLHLEHGITSITKWIDSIEEPIFYSLNRTLRIPCASCRNIPTGGTISMVPEWLCLFAKMGQDGTLPNKVWFDENFLSLLDGHSVHALFTPGVLFLFRSCLGTF